MEIQNFLFIKFLYHVFDGFGGLWVACWPLVPKFAGSNPAEKILSTPSFGGEVKPSVLCRRFVACKRSLNLRVSLNLCKITTGHLSRPHFHFSLQWQTTPRTCPRCSMPEPYRSNDWALVPAKPGLQG